MTRYGLPRKLAVALSAIGWLAMFACLALAILMGTRLVQPHMLLTLLVPMCAGFIGALVLVLLGHVVRAVFDIADCVAAADAITPEAETSSKSDPTPQGGHPQ
jgi:CHASE2 domain-containing sensor protein